MPRGARTLTRQAKGSKIRCLGVDVGPPPHHAPVRTEVAVARVNIAVGRGDPETDGVEGDELLEGRVVAQSAADQVLVAAHACRGNGWNSSKWKVGTGC